MWIKWESQRSFQVPGPWHLLALFLLPHQQSWHTGRTKPRPASPVFSPHSIGSMAYGDSQLDHVESAAQQLDYGGVKSCDIYHTPYVIPSCPPPIPWNRPQQNKKYNIQLLSLSSPKS